MSDAQRSNRELELPRCAHAVMVARAVILNKHQQCGPPVAQLNPEPLAGA
jgi:hypothetical protein